MDIKRSIFNNLADQISRPQVSIILGPRQVEKTFLMQKLKDFCVSQGHGTTYYNLQRQKNICLSLGKISKFSTVTEYYLTDEI